jgi:hypothetical protein
MSPQVWAVLAAAALVPTLADTLAQCPGNMNLEGFGLTSIVPTGMGSPDTFAPTHVSSAGDEIAPVLGSRAYFAQSCKAGVYDHNQYLALNLLGKRMRYTTDMSDLGCGCNAAFYLTSMHQNSHPSECSDYYCDANNVCGQSCAEIDIQEGNRLSWHSTLHGKVDHNGFGKGIGGGGAGWSGPRDWSPSEYGPGASCIDTSKPFQVEVEFPADANCNLLGMEITLSQAAHSDCKLKLPIYSYHSMHELSQALAAGMTPIVSYWNSADMLWMDGKGQDGQGPCATDRPDDCGKSTKFSNFSVSAIPGTMCKAKLTNQQPAEPDLVDLVTDAPTDESNTAAAATTTLLATADEGAGAITMQVVGFLGFLGGALSMGIVFVVMGYVRGRQSQQTLVRQTLPSSSSLANLASTLPSSGSLANLAGMNRTASVRDMRDLIQQQA